MTTTPTRTIRIEITIETMGRLNKEVSHRLASFLVWGWSVGGYGCAGDFHFAAGPGLLHAFDDHAFAGVQPIKPM
jgi:hypothetical protein